MGGNLKPPPADIQAPPVWPLTPLRPGDEAVIGRLRVLTDDDIRRYSYGDIMAAGRLKRGIQLTKA